MRLRSCMAAAALVAVVALACCTQHAAAHGSLSRPASRNVLAPINGETWWREHGNGVGTALTGPKPANGPGELLLSMTASSRAVGGVTAPLAPPWRARTHTAHLHARTHTQTHLSARALARRCVW